MEMDKQQTHVAVWWGDRYDEDIDEDQLVERVPDLHISNDQANWFVVEYLRGPMGPPGPVGATGTRGGS